MLNQNALEFAKQAGIPTNGQIAVRLIAKADINYGPEYWVKVLEGTSFDYLNYAEIIPDEISFCTALQIRLSDQFLPDGHEVIPLDRTGESNAETVSKSLEGICAARSRMLLNFGTEHEFFAYIQPTPATWVELNYKVFFVNVLSKDEIVSTGICKDVSGSLEIGINVPDSVNDLVKNLSELFACSFYAVLIDGPTGIAVTDIGLRQRHEEANTMLLYDDAVSGHPLTKTHHAVRLANCGLELAPRSEFSEKAILYGRGQGSRCATGPLISKISDLSTCGVKSVLVTDDILPSDAHHLEHCSGLVVSRPGPASHIAILARNMGLAVVTNAQGIGKINEGGIVLGGKSVSIGDEVSISEVTGGLYLGNVGRQIVPVDDISQNLLAEGMTGVALSIGKSMSSHKGFPIGLCRSEHQILGSPAHSDFLDYLLEYFQGSPTPQVPDTVSVQFQTELSKTLSNANGNIVNYRLLDVDLEEVLSGIDEAVINNSASISLLRSVRGPRWAVSSGFYSFQIALAVETAQKVAGSNSVDLILSVPSTFSAKEFLQIKEIFDAYLTSTDELEANIRLAPMVENIRMLKGIDELSGLTDVVCFGLNDLTQSIFGLDRQAWSAIRDFYVASDIQRNDPFSDLDLNTVGPLVYECIKRLREGSSQMKFLLCGEPASSFSAHWILGENLDTQFSVSNSAWPSSVFSTAKASARRKGSVTLSKSSLDVGTATAMKRVIAAKSSNKNRLAQSLADSWFRTNCDVVATSSTKNWKVLKKHLIDILFGKREGCYFSPGWDPEEVVKYAKGMRDPKRLARVSVFSNDISCHSYSQIIPHESSDPEVIALISALDREATLNVFPQQDPDQMCFRLVSSPDRYVVEAGWGQAMYVFEEERGQHPILIFQSDKDRIEDQYANAPDSLHTAVTKFLDEKSQWLQGLHEILPPL